MFAKHADMVFVQNPRHDKNDLLHIVNQFEVVVDLSQLVFASWKDCMAGKCNL